MLMAIMVPVLYLAVPDLFYGNATWYAARRIAGSTITIVKPKKLDQRLWFLQVLEEGAGRKEAEQSIGHGLTVFR